MTGASILPSVDSILETLHVVHYLPAVRLAEGGVVRAVLDLCGATAARGHRVTLLTADAADAPGGLAVRLLPGKPRVGGLLASTSMTVAAQALREATFLHLHGPWDMAHVQLARVARALGVSYGVTAHGMLDDWSMAQKGLKKRIHLGLFGRRLLRGAAWLHCTAEGEAAQVRLRVPEAHVVVAPLVFDTAPFCALPAAAPSSDLPRVLFLSRLHPKKGLEKLIAACGELKRRGRPVALGVAGSGDPLYVASLGFLAQKEGVEVEFLGMVTGEDKVRTLRRADVFALPTSQENFGLALVEAMACGVPVVTTRGVDIWPELEGAGARILEVSATAGQWADAIAGMLDTEDRAALGGRGRTWVMEELAPKKTMARYEALYAL